MVCLATCHHRIRWNPCNPAWKYKGNLIAIKRGTLSISHGGNYIKIYQVSEDGTNSSHTHNLTKSQGDQGFKFVLSDTKLVTTCSFIIDFKQFSVCLWLGEGTWGEGGPPPGIGPPWLAGGGGGVRHTTARWLTSQAGQSHLRPPPLPSKHGFSFFRIIIRRSVLRNLFYSKLRCGWWRRTCPFQVGADGPLHLPHPAEGGPPSILGWSSLPSAWPSGGGALMCAPLLVHATCLSMNNAKCQCIMPSANIFMPNASTFDELHQVLG